jgi:hypothetical protein
VAPGETLGATLSNLPINCKGSTIR